MSEARYTENMKDTIVAINDTYKDKKTISKKEL